MRICELSPSTPTNAAHRVGSSLDDTAQFSVHDLESLIKQAESLTPASLSSLQSVSSAIRSAVARLGSLRHLPDPSKIIIWKFSYRLWNACVDLSNSLQSLRIADSAVLEHQARLRHAAADLLLLAGSPAGIPSPELKAASFFYKTGVLWLELLRLDLAEECFERATSLAAAIPVERVAGGEERRLLLDINLSRARTAWEASDHGLAVALLARSKNLLFGSAGSFQALAEEYLRLGKLLLSEKSAPDLVLSPGKLLDEALDLCEKGLRLSRSGEDGAALVSLKCKCLRFLAAERLQAGDQDGALRCIELLRGDGGVVAKEAVEHPSVSLVAMRAWIGKGNVAEAERELKGMAISGRVAGEVLTAAFLEYLNAVGVQRAKGLLLSLAGRRQLGHTAMVTVLQRVVSEGRGGGGGDRKTRVVAEIASDERISGLFSGEDASKEQRAMHAVLWNYGTEHFQSKDYDMAAELFEKSMLYMKHDDDNRSRRANCYRVLCLCHLGLSQLDRAREYIDEAEKLEPNIHCAFLKLKICLQKKAEKEAIAQIESMVNCIDFKPEFLTLSTHEAMASRLIPVAIASLSALLRLYSPGRSMSMTEVAVLRNLITLLMRCPDADAEVLKYTRRARARMNELGPEGFFGSGAVGDREHNWFAALSWNMGLKTGKEKNYETCLEFLELATEFYGSAGEETAEKSATLCNVRILSIAAMIAREDEMKVALSDTDVMKAAGMLDKVSKFLATASSKPSLQLMKEDRQPPIEPGLFFLHILNAYQLLGRLSEDPNPKQLQLIKSYVSNTKACTPQSLLQLGLIALQGPSPNPEAARFVLNTCLNQLLASPSPDYQTVSLVIRKLVGLSALQGKKDASEADPVYEGYKQAYKIVVGLKDGEYPVEEGKWLAITAWNRSAVAVRLGQAEVAKKWMKMGLDLALHTPRMESLIGGMKDCLSNFDEITRGSPEKEQS